MTTSPEQAIALAARTSYGRLVALLASRSRDVAAAEDALSEAFVAALERWPEVGVPANPDAWLLAVARRRLLDDARRASVRERAEPALAYAISLLEPAPDPLSGHPADALQMNGTLPDRRLELLFVCAHPAIDPGIRTPLMLQAVLGLDASVIASAFLTAPATMAQRLVRAKRKIRDAAVPFELPPVSALPARLNAVLEAIYAAFGTAWDAIHGSELARADLADEAIYLGRLVVAALPDEPEPRGLLALMLYCEARRSTRRTTDGAYIPLRDQNAESWNREHIRQAESLLQAAARMQRSGRFQLEAAIQSAHLAPAFGARSDDVAIVALYDALVAVAPTIGAYVNRAAAIARADGPLEALNALNAIDGSATSQYQPAWVLRAHLLAQLGKPQEAAAARERAVGLTEDPAVRAYLLTG
jgi:RNA polymerase sigma-70 factor (ECF subfamily)